MVLSDNAKHNANGRVDETGAVRNRDVEICAVGATALHLFSQYHLMDHVTPPPFSPDFSDSAKAEGFGQYGKRAWYRYRLFPSPNGLDVSLGYEGKYLVA